MGVRDRDRQCQYLRYAKKLLDWASALVIRGWTCSGCNGLRDAETITEAVQPRTMKFVAPKSVDQLDSQATHRVCAPLINHGTGGISQLRAFIIAFAWLAAVGSAATQDKPDEPQPVPEKASPSAGITSETTESICLLIESAAAANGLPVDFFARVIWRESRYNPAAVGPPTRTGQRAQGIGQFMPGTAAERRLLDPFNPVEALPKSAEFLSELRGQFGSLGLAAAAYNAGPQRVRDWLAGRRKLPRETRGYVWAVTGRSAEDWAAAGPSNLKQKNPPAPPCKDLTVIVKREPNTFVAELERRVSEGAASPWGVQLGAGFSRSKVLTRYAEIQRQYRTVLAGHDAMIIRSRLSSSGIAEFYQVRLGAQTRDEADRLCAGLRAAGGHCLVLRNPGHPPG